MAGRLLPIALAMFAGVAIGVSTFGEEFKEQRRRRLQEEYNRDLAAVSSLNSEGPSPMASSTIKAPPQPEQSPAKTETAGSSATHSNTAATHSDVWASKVSSMLGFRARSGKENAGGSAKEQVPTMSTIDSSKQQP